MSTAAVCDDDWSEWVECDDFEENEDEDYQYQYMDDDGNWVDYDPHEDDEDSEYEDDEVIQSRL